MLAAFAGPPHWPQFWVTTNDFWQMESNANYEFFHDNESAKYDPPVGLGSPRPVGRLVFDIPPLRVAGYHVEQDFSEARTEATFTQEDGTRLRLSYWVAAGENLLVVSFLANSCMQVSASFLFPDEPGKGCDGGVDFTGSNETDISYKDTYVGLIGGQPQQMKRITPGGLICGFRAFCDRVDVPTRVGFAGRFLNQASTEITLEPDRETTFILVLRSWAKISRPYEMACSRAGWITQQDIDDLWQQHRRWWFDFWSTSGITLDDPVLEQRYYLSQYVLASVSRDPDYPPNILGISTFDRMAWNGNYKINYNHQSPYLGLLVSGHFEQSDPHDAPYLAMLDICREMSRRLLKHRGCYMPLGLGPAGMVSEPLLLHMKSQAVHGAINMLMRYALTLDHKYARRVYPFLKSVADFWEDDLILDGETYRIVDDGMHERTTAETERSGVPENATNSLGYLKTFFTMMPEISAALGLDESKHTIWRSIAHRLSPYACGTLAQLDPDNAMWRNQGTQLTELLPDDLCHMKVFYNEEKGSQWSLSFPANIMHIYPAGAIGLDSPDELLEMARNTITVRSAQEKALAVKRAAANGQFAGRHIKTGAWNDTNISCLFFPAAVRVGYDPEIIWQELKNRIEQVGMPNGFIHDNPHGIENLSTVPNTLQEMMLLSHEGIIRLFRVWPRKSHPNARFEKLWAYGAFQVSAALCNGTVTDLKITSCKGQDCVLENPWPGKPVQVIREPSGQQDVFVGARFYIPTHQGETLLIQTYD